MSYSLFLTRENDLEIPPEELSSTFSNISQEQPEIRFEPLNETKDSYNVWFKENEEELDKVTIDYETSETGEREYKKIVVGSNRKFIGYIEWVAYLLAQKLNLKVFDPQPPFNNYVKIEELKHTPEQAQAYQKQYEEKNEHKS
ncbi:MAG: hypothetical protein A2700_00805 [Candidatus Blackburnbacteria bacterium RIFCSPHIGHO2_01_FULL_44_64]|uniref:Uncharacterized protein n=1 Tax=Candidatus Blackburnbacteria bacterium RIFCSPHIGHO2_02_FULL_44_20 TaxID=1797516 RepID=A0A1G1V510_9BACT|nr:MAG: hypothetical protein A2700_00805 [Candidatus Blackburnbacteria bacterium RIFCSPHIGHO2_01_FULL_44_64]OGY10490.1 MAG: hypothetical protein A3D26_00115 [Candidatus Blackburnbacteria bacterium RIFCSPHIGHO2_02_FULL_44_20]OGY12315.1 MAG: hypothetical protein A3E16_00535 [Candidatus Blackburnbacteria bacterium RIFCSPHIGHO2_12_FULL_44_25]OGY15044.1 MAG: hypothetical protein A3A62_02150 [Candidatus Blackburnbacteria bacterium RIFCSPLOWO2_01_FULL_44_43]OGY17300.1 MAG: hypothetical protein A3H88_0